MQEFNKLKQEVESVKASLFASIEELLLQSEENSDKFYNKGVKSAKGRLKKAAREIKKKIHGPTIRTEMNKIKTAASTLIETLK